MAEPTETIQAAEEKRSISWGVIILWPVVILILYIMSVGPFMMMYDRELITNTRIMAVYEPLDWAYKYTCLHKPLNLYLSLWCKRFKDEPPSIY